MRPMRPSDAEDIYRAVQDPENSKIHNSSGGLSN